MAGLLPGKVSGVRMQVKEILFAEFRGEEKQKEAFDAFFSQVCGTFRIISGGYWSPEVKDTIAATIAELCTLPVRPDNIVTYTARAAWNAVKRGFTVHAREELDPDIGEAVADISESGDPPDVILSTAQIASIHRRLCADLEAEIERSPKANEISHQLDMSPEDVVNAMQYSRRHSSLDTPFQDGEDNSLMDVLENPQDINPDEMLMRESMKEDVIASLDTLSERERAVIEMYYGIGRESALTLNEIGEEFNLTRERVRQIKAKAIQRLGHKSRSKMLRKYLG